MNIGRLRLPLYFQVNHTDLSNSMHLAYTRLLFLWQFFSILHLPFKYDLVIPPFKKMRQSTASSNDHAADFFLDVLPLF